MATRKKQDKESTTQPGFKASMEQEISRSTKETSDPQGSGTESTTQPG